MVNHAERSAWNTLTSRKIVEEPKHRPGGIDCSILLSLSLSRQRDIAKESSAMTNRSPKVAVARTSRSCWRKAESLTRPVDFRSKRPSLIRGCFFSANCETIVARSRSRAANCVTLLGPPSSGRVSGTYPSAFHLQTD